MKNIVEKITNIVLIITVIAFTIYFFVEGIVNRNILLIFISCFNIFIVFYKKNKDNEFTNITNDYEKKSSEEEGDNQKDTNLFKNTDKEVLLKILKKEIPINSMIFFHDEEQEKNKNGKQQHRK